MPWVEKLPSGKHRALYRDAEGRRRSAGTFAQKREAQNAARDAESESRKIGWRDPAGGLITWGEWVAVWWPTRAVEPGTLSRDLTRRTSRLDPRWGTVPLIRITRHDVRAWVADLTADGLKPATVQRCVHLLSASLTAAVDAELIPTNAAYRIRIAKGETSDHRYLTRYEYAAIARELPSAFDETLLATLAGTGMRWGEAVGLQIQRVDFGRGIVRVAEGWDDRMRRVKPYPKGRKIRDVPLAPWVGERLEFLADGRRTGLIFEVDGAVPGYSNWRSRVWLPTLAAAGVGHVRIHDLRHTFASWLIQDGVSLEEVGRLLGHVSPITTRGYAHLAETPRAAVLAALPDPTRGAGVGQLLATPDYTPLRLAR